MRVIRENFSNFLEGTSSEELAVSSIVLLHFVIPMVTSKTVIAMGKDRPYVVDFSTKLARIIMKLASHTKFAADNMLSYNHLIRFMSVPFAHFCMDMSFLGNDYQVEPDFPPPKVSCSFLLCPYLLTLLPGGFYPI